MLGDRVGACRVLLAVIGPRWLDILEVRLDQPNDYVRIEIAEGLQRKVRVIPVIIDSARRRLPRACPTTSGPWRGSTRCRCGPTRSS